MANVTIELREIGTVALAEYTEIEPVEHDTVPVDLKNETASFPFQLTETEAVLSYLHNEKVKYVKLNGIRQDPVKAYPSLEARNSE